MQSRTLETIMVDEETPEHDHIHKGLRAFEECRWQDAITAFRHTLAEDPSDIEVEGKLTFALSQARQYDEAIEVLQRLRIKQPQLARWPYMIGYQFYTQKLWKEAVSWFSEALTLKPDYIIVLYRKGYAHLQSDQYDEGVKAFQLCIESWHRLSSVIQQTEQKSYGKANFQLGKAYLSKGLSLKARRPLEIAVQMDGEDHDRRYELGKCLLKNDDVGGAIRELEKANALNPGTDYVIDRLAQAYVARGDLERAERVYESIPPHRRRAFVLKNLGSVHLDQGKTDKASETLRLAAKKDPNNHNIQYLLGRALETCSPRGSAKQAYMRAIDLRRQKYGLDFPEAQERLREVEKTLMSPEALQQLDSNGRANENIGVDEQEGVVDHYNSSRGFGFINSSCQKIFFHITAVVDGYIPVVGRRVRFHIEQSEKGPRATKVMPS